VAEPQPNARCARCAAELAPSLLVCPACGALVHADELKRLAATATERTNAVDLAAALVAWRRAVELLPSGTRQHAEVTARIAELSQRVTTSPAQPSGSRWKLGGGAIGAAAVALLSKGKLLLLGLTKLSTLGSMLLAFSVYLTLWSWKFALGFIAGIYVHEMGHVFALRRYGIAATAPMFIPGFGALVRLKQHPATVGEDARVGLAGPIWGLAASVAFFAASRLGAGDIFAALAQVSGLLNLFNLTPFGPLDGGRAFNAMTRGERLLVTAAIGAAYLVFSHPMLLLLLVVAVGRTFSTRVPDKPDWSVTLEFVALVAALAGLAALPAPNPR
jgi:Zn-dependent protease